MGIIGTPQLLEAESSIDDQYARSYQRVYAVWATTDVLEQYVRSNLGIGINATHPDDNRALCKSISVKLASKNKTIYDSTANPAGAGTPPAPNTSCFLWNATVEWGPWNPVEHTSTGDPTNQPVRVFPESQTFQEICDVDINGNPVVTSAYSYFDPPIMRDRTRPILRVVRNENSFSDSTILGYADKVNSDVVGSYAVRTLKCSAPTSQEKYSQFTGNTYYEVTYILAYNPDTWDKVVLDQDYVELDPSDATKRRRIIVEGAPASTPQLLDGSGHYLAPPVDHTNVNFLTFQVYETMSFATAFGFPTGTFN